MGLGGDVQLLSRAQPCYDGWMDGIVIELSVRYGMVMNEPYECVNRSMI